MSTSMRLGQSKVFSHSFQGQGHSWKSKVACTHAQLTLAQLGMNFQVILKTKMLKNSFLNTQMYLKLYHANTTIVGIFNIYGQDKFNLCVKFLRPHYTLDPRDLIGRICVGDHKTWFPRIFLKCFPL